MAKLFFGLNVSLDGYVDHEEFAPNLGCEIIRVRSRPAPFPREIDVTVFRHWEKTAQRQKAGRRHAKTICRRVSSIGKFPLRR